MDKHTPGLSKRHAPRSSSASNSYVERAVGFLEAMCRTLRFHVESKYKIILTAAHPIVPWLVRHASFLVARFQQHSDGFTSFQRRWSKDFRQPLCEFTEQVWFRPTARKRFKFDSEFFKGLWLGRVSETGEILIGTIKGVFPTRTVRRMPIEDKYLDQKLFNGFQALPWDHRLDGKFHNDFLHPKPDKSSIGRILPDLPSINPEEDVSKPSSNPTTQMDVQVPSRKRKELQEERDSMWDDLEF